VNALPLVTLYLTERCNSRCVTCDYWKHGRRDVTLDAIERMLPDLVMLGTHTALISGGEPLLNREWPQIAALLRSRGISLWLLTSGLSLAKHAERVASQFQSITVSLDGTCAETYAAIRGVDAFDKVCEGIRAVVERGPAVGLRVTLQRANYRELPRFVTLARELQVRQVSFLAVDVANPHAFARQDDFTHGLALTRGDVVEFERLLFALERDHAADFRDGFIAEAPDKLRRLRDYFAALNGDGAFPAVRCNAPEFSAVIDVHGAVAPCFFIPGGPAVAGQGIATALESPPMVELRRAIRAGERPECHRCVCSMYREPEALTVPRAAERTHARF